MPEWLWIVGFLVVYAFLTGWVMPKFGVPT